MRTESVVVPFPRTTLDDRLELGLLVPSSRTLLTAFGVLAVILLAILAARETSLFGIRAIEVSGADSRVTRQVQRALDGRTGASLFGLDLESAELEVSALPTVAAVSFDRAYPHTLRVTVVPERPVALVRQGAHSFVVSERGRVVATAERTGAAGAGTHLGGQGRAARHRRIRGGRAAGPRSGRWLRSRVSGSRAGSSPSRRRTS